MSLHDQEKRNRISRLLAHRKEARAAKDWTLSDNIRNDLDELGAFVIDKKDGDQKVLIRDDDYFVHMEKAGRLYSITFTTRRKYVEWRIQQDIKANERFDAWLHSMQQSIKAKRAKLHDTERENKTHDNGR